MVTEREQERRANRYELAKRLGILFIAVAVTILLGLTFAGVNILVGLAKDNHQTLTTIKDCTQPTGKCYRNGQARTRSAVANINKVVILAAACASQHPGQTVGEVQSCVIDRLAKQKGLK